MSKTVDMAQHFTIPALLRLTAPSMVMVLFTSIYEIVDGLFISNLVGKTAFASVNLIMPFIMVLGCIGFMMGTGGSEVISKTRGEGKSALANQRFSLIVYFTLAVAVIMAILGALFMEQVAAALGASEDMMGYCVFYGRMCMISLPAFVLQYAFQAFFTAAGKPKLGLAVVVIAGVAHIVFDALLMMVFQMGILGACVSTIICEFVGGFLPLVYFFAPNSSHLRLGRTTMDWRILGHACINGSSEMVSNVSESVVSMLYNFQLMALYGENGVAAFGACMYICFVFIAVFSGYSIGSAPLMSYSHGAKNKTEMNSLWRKSLVIVAVSGIAMFTLAEVLAGPFAYIYVGYDTDLRELTEFAFRLFSFAYLVCGFSMYGSSLFTSLGNGLVSGIIAFVRVLVFEAAAIMLLPQIFGPSAIWLSWTVGEVLALALTFAFMFYLGKHYGFRKVHQTI